MLATRYLHAQAMPCDIRVHASDPLDVTSVLEKIPDRNDGTVNV